MPPPDTGEEDEYFIARVEKIRVYLIDEPERHLHPIAQREAASWIANLVEQPGAPSVVVATHSPAFLDLPSQLAQYLGVTREEGASRAHSITTEEMRHLDGFADRLGVSRADLIQLVRLVIIVEGKHDKLVVEHFFAHELARARAIVLPIRGTRNKGGIPESETLAALGVPIVVLFDDVHAAFLDGERDAETNEEKHLVSLREQWRERRGDAAFRLVAFPLPDIFAALPEAALREAIRKRHGTMPADGIAGMLARYRDQAATNFKDFLASECRVGRESRDVDGLLAATLAHSDGRHPDVALRDAVFQAIGDVKAAVGYEDA